MTWLGRTRGRRTERLATDREVHSTFKSERENLSWTALMITGDPLLVEKAIVDASGLQKTATGVFVDWLAHWANAATARASANLVRDPILRSAREYEILECEHLEHAPLQATEILAVRQLNPEEIVEGLDPLARTVLVLRGIQRATIFDCAQFLRLPRQAVAKAYCHALTWLEQRGAKIGNADRPFTCACIGSDYLI